MASVLFLVGLFVASLAVLLKGSEWFTGAAEKIGLSFGIPSFIVGITIVAVGTSLPELISSIFAMLQGSPEIVVGNVMGSNIANILLILGAAGVMGKEIKVERELIRVDLPVFAAAAVFLAIAVWNTPFTVVEGVLGLLALVIYTYFTLEEKEADDGDLVEDVEEEIAKDPVDIWTYAALLGSLVLVFAGANYTVEAIIGIADILGIGTGVIAVSAVAIGTSLPELMVSIMAARRGVPEIAVGNILGSNIFNTFAVMGIPSFLGPITVPDDIRFFVLPVMVLATLLYFFITQDRNITKWESGTLLILYALFLYNLFTVV